MTSALSWSRLTGCSALTAEPQLRHLFQDYIRASYRQIGGRHVDQSKLHTLFALPAVNRQAADGVQLEPAALHDRRSERLTRRTERNGVDNGAIAGTQPHPDVRLTDLLGIRNRMRRQRQHRLRVACTERTGARDRRYQLAGGGASRERAVDQERVGTARRRNRGAERLLKVGAKLGKRRLAQRDTGRHSVTAALDQEPILHSLPHRAAKIDARDRAPRAGAKATWLERDRKCRTTEFFLQTRCDKPDHAGMPALGRRNDDRSLVLSAERRHRFGLRLRHGRNLDRLALAVEPVELGGEPSRLDLVLMQKEINAERCAANAAAGIDAWTEQESQVPRLRRA